jgi:hypothetical protein
LLLVAGGAGFGFLVLYGLAGASVGAGGRADISGAISRGSMAALGLGAATVAIGRPPLREAGVARAGFAFIAIGLIGLSPLEVWWGNSTSQGDPLGSPTILLYILGALAGGAAALVGQIVVAVVLVRESGVSRQVGVLFTLGMGAIVFSTQAGGNDIGLTLVTLAGAVGWGGLGSLVFHRAAGRSTPITAEHLSPS